jgi:hypothetical protein
MRNKFLIIALNLILSFQGFSQNVLILKNGAKMNGKIEEYSNDTMSFTFMGNKLRFKSSDINSVYFDDKSFTVDLKNTTKEKNTIKQERIYGVVTYFFNENFGNKPDVGAEIYVIDSENIPNFNYATVDSFYNVSIYRSFKRMWTGIPSNRYLSDIYNKAKLYDLDKKNINSLDKRASTNISLIIDSKDAIKTMADGVGNYSIKVNPGSYYVCIRSKNRSDSFITESSGSIKCEKIVVGENEDGNLNCEFGYELKRSN